MAKPKLKILSVGSTHSDWETAIGNRLKDQFEIQWVEKQSLSTEELALSLKNHDFSLIQGELSLQLKKIVVRRSVKSFFIDFIDFVYHQGGEIWGRSLFSEVVSKLLKTYIRDQDEKGSVIFLGHNPLVWPVLQVLALNGFNDFVFLKLSEGDISQEIKKGAAGLFNIQTSVVDSTAFIQSQKEYSHCFVMQDHYPQQTLEDMSYFHFLSSESMVFDFSGQSNFMFEEVEALGVKSVKFDSISTIWFEEVAKNITEVAKK